MKFFIITAALVAATVASPVLVMPDITGPAAVDYVPVNPGPSFVDGYVPVNPGPSFVDGNVPVNPGPAFVEEYEPINVGPALLEGNEDISAGPVIVEEAVNIHAPPVVQIILNINSQAQVVDVPLPVNPEVIAPLPTPVLVAEEVAPSPVQIGTPVLPAPVPVINLPDDLN